jgi:hypothetical protein
MFGALREAHGAATLADVTRQKDADAKAAAEMLARGEFREALGVLNDLGSLHRAEALEESRAALVEKWKADSAAAPDKSRFVFAYTNADVLKLNAELRAVRKERGELGADHALTTKDGKLNFAANDRLIFNTTDKRKGIINGATGTITNIDGTAITLRLDGKSDRVLTFDAAEMDGFRHAYAGTIYKGQGRTLDEVYLYHTRHWKDAASYVALTRHRESVAIYTAAEVAGDLDELARQMARHDERRASVAFATGEEAEGIKRDQYARVADQVTAQQPEASPPPDQARAKEPTPEAVAPVTTSTGTEQRKATTGRLARLVAEMKAMISDFVPTRPREARAGRDQAPPELAPTGQPAPLPLAAVGRENGANLPRRSAAETGQAADPRDDQRQPPAPTHQNPARALGAEPMPLGLLALTAAANTETLEDVATAVREGVAEMAKDAAPAGQSAEAESPPADGVRAERKESTFERAKRLAAAERAALREQENAEGRESGGQDRGRGRGGNGL